MGWGRLPAVVQLSSLCDRHVGVKLWSISYQLDFTGGSDGEESTCNAGDLGWIPGLGRSPGEGKGYPFQYSGLEVAKSRAQLSDFSFMHSKHSYTFFSCHNYCHFPGEGNGYPLQYSCLGNPMDSGACTYFNYPIPQEGCILQYQGLGSTQFLVETQLNL